MITDGKCGKAPGDGELVGVPVSVLEVDEADVVPVSVVGVVVVGAAVAVVVGVVVVVVIGAGGGGLFGFRLLTSRAAARVIQRHVACHGR